MVEYGKAVGLFSRDVRLFMISSALMGLCWKGIYAVLFNLYLIRLGYNPQAIGVLNAVPTFVYGLSCLPAGAIGARWGSRRAMIVGVAVVAIGLAMPPCAEWVPLRSQYGWLLGSYSVAWVGAALVIVNSSPFLMDTTGVAEREHAFSFQVGLWPLAGFLGSMLGGLLPIFFAGALDLTPDSAEVYRYALFVAAALYVPALPILLSTGRQPRAEVEATTNLEEPIPWAQLLLVSLVTLLYVGGDGVFRSFYNVYLDVELGLSTPAIGAISAAGNIAATAAALAAPLVMARWGRERGFVAVTLGMALGLIPLALVRHWTVAAVSVVVMASLPYLARPILTVFQMHLVARRWQSAMSAVGTMGRAFGWSIASVVGGYLVVTAGYPSTFLAGAVTTALGSATFWILSRDGGPLARQA